MGPDDMQGDSPCCPLGAGRWCRPAFEADPEQRRLEVACNGSVALAHLRHGPNVRATRSVCSRRPDEPSGVEIYRPDGRRPDGVGRRSVAPSGPEKPWWKAWDVELLGVAVLQVPGNSCR